jgi:hypothetical protein
MMTSIFFGEVFKKLQEKKVNYLVVGGIAVALHGVPRFTADADFVLELVPQNIQKFIKAITELGYEPKVPVNPLDFADAKIRNNWIKNKNMKVFSFWQSNDPLKLIDVFVSNPIDYNELNKEKIVKKAAGIEIPIPSIKHLIQLKKIAGRSEDLRDIQMLEKLHDQKEK